MGEPRWAIRPMLKGPGDFSPPDPVECPEDCVFYTPERGDHDYCQYWNGCQYDPENQPVRGEESEFSWAEEMDIREAGDE